MITCGVLGLPDSTTTQSHSSSTSSCLDSETLNNYSRFPVGTTPIGCEPHFLIVAFFKFKLQISNTCNFNFKSKLLSSISNLRFKFQLQISTFSLTSNFVNFIYFQLHISSTSNFFNFKFLQLQISSTSHFFNFKFLQIQISSSSNFFKFQFLQVPISSMINTHCVQVGSLYQPMCI